MSKWIQILQRLSIGLKLTMSFIFLLIVIAVIGITGIQQIYFSQGQTDVVFESGVEPLALTNTISVEFLMTRVKLREAFINDDAEKMKMYLTEASQHVKKHNNAVEEYRKTLITEEGRKLLIEYANLFQQFEIVGSDITNALYAGNREVAVNILRGRCVEISDQLLSKYNEVLENKKTMLETLKQQTRESNQKAVQWQLLMVAIGVILSMMLSVIITLSLTKPVKKLMEIAKFFSIAENYERNSKAKTEMVGYLQANIGKDEIAQLTNSFADMIETVQDNYIQIKQKNEQSNVLTQEASILKQESEERENHLRDNIKVILQSVQAFAQGDLTTEVKGTETGTYTSSTIATLISEYNRALANVREMIIQIVGSINDVANGVKQISGSTEQLSAGIHEQSAQVAEISVAVEEMSSTIESNAQLSSRIAGDARKATEEAQNGGDAIKKMIANVEAVSKAVIESADNIERLGKSSEQIGEIVQVIDEIADQTNLLALNAAIEAARAGEQGRGFAVVADEVRKLAERTQLATKEISQKIAVIRRETTLSVQTMNKGKELVQAGDIFVQQTNTSLREIIGHSQKVADLVSQLAAANEQQATTSHEVAKNIATVASVVHQSAAATSEIADNTSQLDRLTYEVIELIQQFRTENNSRVIGNSLQGQRMLVK